jgi:alanine racemase
MHDRVLQINLGAIVENIRRVRAFTGKKILACVKSNGYGMGAVQISRAIESCVDWFGVATIEEARCLRKSGIKKNILILGQVLPCDVAYARAHRISVTVGSMESLESLLSHCRYSRDTLGIHLKIDTGMGRIGIMPDAARTAVSRILAARHLRLEGIFTHLAEAENPDTSFSRQQVKVFNAVLKTLPPQARKFTHVANSAGVVNVPESWKDFSMVRIGLLLYGVYPTLFLRIFRNKPALKYALTGKTTLVLARDMQKGATIGYGRTYACEKDMRIGVAAIGYGDGLNRHLSNKFFMKYNGRLFRIRGNICMDQTMLEIPGFISPGDTLTFLDEQLSAEDMAELCNTTVHEILCNFGATRLTKEYHGL